MENFQNENGPRLEKVWEPLVYGYEYEETQS